MRTTLIAAALASSALLSTAHAEAASGTRRQLFYFMGEGMLMGGHQVDALTSVEVSCNEPMELINGSEVSELLMLQGMPIGELVIQDGPFVMNSAYEISQAYEDYRQTQFGGWGWPSKDPVHDEDRSRFESR